MRILLDECLPARLGRELAGHEVDTAPKMGWAGLKNGALLNRAVAAGFDVFLTVDRNLPKQQNLATYAIAVVVLRCATNDITDLTKLVPELLLKLPAAKKGEALLVGL
jgi:predicted nuclease of predicted toxin-antitoxin system